MQTNQTHKTTARAGRQAFDEQQSQLSNENRAAIAVDVEQDRARARRRRAELTEQTRRLALEYDRQLARLKKDHEDRIRRICAEAGALRLWAPNYDRERAA